MSVYCNNKKCEYSDDGSCEYGWPIVIDEDGFCMSFMQKEVANEND